MSVLCSKIIDLLCTKKFDDFKIATSVKNEHSRLFIHLFICELFGSAIIIGFVSNFIFSYDITHLFSNKSVYFDTQIVLISKKTPPNSFNFINRKIREDSFEYA